VNLKELRKKLDSIVQILDETSNFKRKYSRLIEMPILVAMEFVKGCPMNSVPMDMFNDKNWILKAMTEMGKYLIFDVIINNWDRYPLIWDHDGNIENFFFLVGNLDRPVVGIDQSVTSINDNNIEAYMKKIEDLIEEINQFPLTGNEIDWSQFTYLHRIDEYVEMNTGIKLDLEQMRAITHGMKEMAIKSTEVITLNILQDIYREYDAEVQSLIGKMTWGMDNNSRYGMTKINVDFMFSIITLFKTKFSENV